MLSNPTFSKLETAIIALLVLCGAAMLIEIEAHHRILIVAPEGAETATDSDPPDDIRPAIAPTFTPANALRRDTEQ